MSVPAARCACPSHAALGVGRPIGARASRCQDFTRERLARGWSRREVAARVTALGVPTTESAIAQWEASGRTPCEVRIEALALAFAVPEPLVADWFGVGFAFSTERSA